MISKTSREPATAWHTASWFGRYDENPNAEFSRRSSLLRSCPSASVIVDMGRIGGHSTGAGGENARDVLELDSTVPDAERTQDFVDALKNGFALGMRHVLDQYMRAERVRMRA